MLNIFFQGDIECPKDDCDQTIPLGEIDFQSMNFRHLRRVFLRLFAEPVPCAERNGLVSELAKKALPSMVVDILEEKLAQQNLDQLKSSIEGLFK